MKRKIEEAGEQMVENKQVKVENINEDIEKLKKHYEIKVNDNSLLKLLGLEKIYRDYKKNNGRAKTMSKVIIDDITIELRQKYKDDILIENIN